MFLFELGAIEVVEFDRSGAALEAFADTNYRAGAREEVENLIVFLGA